MAYYCLMAGIYVHIPFCRKACHYCNFHFSTSFQKKDELIQALVEEITLRSHYLQALNINTVYYGGGTPSALPWTDIAKVHQAVTHHFPPDPFAEITLEANPDDINFENLQAWKDIGINRLSIGIQAFQDGLLAEWNRNHNAAQALESISLAQQLGFHNLSADLIYGGQGLSDEDWKFNIQTLISASVPHISCYALTIESGTVLAHQIKKGQINSPDDEQGNRQYAIMQHMLKAAGYEQYEVSNFAKPGFQSRHNRSYWSGSHYLGIGPSAHSYNGISRQWNVANNVKYTHALSHHKVPFEIELLTDAQQYNEIVMTGLRTSTGIDVQRIKGINDSFEEHLATSIAPYLQADKIFKTDEGNYALRAEYYFFADGIAANLFKLET